MKKFILTLAKSVFENLGHGIAMQGTAVVGHSFIEAPKNNLNIETTTYSQNEIHYFTLKFLKFR